MPTRLRVCPPSRLHCHAQSLGSASRGSKERSELRERVQKSAKRITGKLKVAGSTGVVFRLEGEVRSHLREGVAGVLCPFCSGLLLSLPMLVPMPINARQRLADSYQESSRDKKEKKHNKRKGTTSTS